MKSAFLRKRKPASRESPLANSAVAEDDDEEGPVPPEEPKPVESPPPKIVAPKDEGGLKPTPRGLKKAPSMKELLPLKSPRALPTVSSGNGKSLSPPPSDKPLLSPRR